MVFVVRACAPGRTHRALVPAGCGFVPAGLRTALLPGLAPGVLALGGWSAFPSLLQRSPCPAQSGRALVKT